MSTAVDSDRVADELRARLAKATRELESHVPPQFAHNELVALERAELAIRYFECNACTEHGAREAVFAACDAVGRAVHAARAA